ncbi:NAD-dependent epimerase/dehydratase family protein [Pseudonocardia spinosispora]|uniref:NAD-dependent epimerase/dehydratase family protein n=1 Tax=Pseudonocardia spinosispora TaxID=103441 RepID=UPI000428AE5D|nr:NAD-dependent epimerase/dehydratase family protein [Pseudonocardia spinosispora]
MGGGREVLVLGARGSLGALCVEAFRASGWRTVAASRRAAPGFRQLDLTEPDTAAPAIAQADVVVNTVPDPRLGAERLVLRDGGVLINLSAMPAASATELRSDAGPARGAVLMNAGVAPGVTNLLAADLVAAHPDADELEMVFTISAASTAGPAGASFVHRGLTGRVHHRTTTVTLPAPFGARRCLGFAEPDGGWLTGTNPAVRPYVCFSEPGLARLMLALNGARLLSRLPRAALRSRPLRGDRAASSEPVAHWVAAYRDGRRLGVRTLEGTGDYRMAAASAVVFADALLGLPALAPGVHNPEELFTLPRLRGPLSEAGIRTVEHTVSAPA